ncbi:MAG: hypothetical protein OXC62_05335, partial [Aestuariivita sp.]|nr:hypothetical protein [Aestuariivita sp.]
DALMTSTDGWPRHVHWAQRALAEALLQEDVNGQADRIPDWGAVQSHADTLRCGYYKTQYSKHMNYDPRLTAKVLFDVAMAEQTQDCLSSAQLRKNIKSYCEQHETSDFECPPDMTYADFITHLIHCGALRETDDGTTLTCPIPSFQSYIIERGGLEIPFVRPLESSIET